MGGASDILIGLNAGTSAIRAAAFDPAGRQLGFATVPNHWVRVDRLGAEQDLVETWHLTVRVIRLLAEQVPDLARRAAALAITGQADGTWLIDEDGDPVGPAMLWLDCRAAPMVDAWRDGCVAPAVAEITGTPPCAALQSAQIAWLLRHRPELVEQAAHALHCKDWLYHCCTGERATDPAEAVRAYGDLRTGSLDRRVLELLGIEEAVRLLPEVVDGSRCHGCLTAAAAAAIRLRQGTPVVLGPPEPLAAVLGTGILAPDHAAACTVFGSADIHARACTSAEALALPRQAGAATMPLPVPDARARVVASLGAATAIDWVVGLAEELIADAGLIGLSHADLVALLDRKAAQTAPGGALFHPSTTPGDAPDPSCGPWGRVSLSGIGSATGFGDIVRTVYEGVAFETRACHALLGGLPDELRIAGRGSASATFRRILSAVLGRPVRASLRPDPAPAGAALVAAVALGHHASVRDGLATWVEPWLSEPEPVDEDLRATYARLCKLYIKTRTQPAGVSADPA